MHPDLQAFHLVLFAAGLMGASVWDILQRRIPNWLTVTFAITGLAARFLQGGYWAGVWGVLGLVVGIALLIYPFHRRWIGAADVKLLGGCGAWLGPQLCVYGAALAALFGLAISLIYWVRCPPEVRREIWTHLKFVWWVRAIPDVNARPHSQTPPYAPAIAAGTVGALLLYYFGAFAKMKLLWLSG